MLQIDGLTRDFGGLTAVNQVDMSLQKGEIVGLIGPNGAGKTTFFNLVTGYIRPTKGRITFEGSNITNKSPNQISAKGIVRTFQGNNIFMDFTVLENMVLACHLKPGVKFWETCLRTSSGKRKDKFILQRSTEILETVGLKEMAGLVASSLAHGHKRILGIAIALAAQPKLLLLDEPLSGMNAQEVDEAVNLIRKLWQSGLSILLIEHNMRAAMNLCQKLVVLSFGKKIAEGTPDEVKTNPEVIKAYLGTGDNVTQTG
jgi:branched-chain amino acid transport system ATP-binding protein